MTVFDGMLFDPATFQVGAAQAVSQMVVRGGAGKRGRRPVKHAWKKKHRDFEHMLAKRK